MATPKKAAAKKTAAQGKGTAVAKVSNARTEVTQTDELFGTVAGMGMEQVTNRDLIIPRIGILQKLSPELDKKHAKFIQGAEEGDFCNIGMNEVIEKPMNFIPCFFNKQWLEWAPRKSGEGLKGIHDSDAIMQRTKKDNDGRHVLPNKNYIVETSQLYVIILLPDGSRMPAFIPFVSTQHKKVRQLLTDSRRVALQRGDGSKFNPPLFYRYWEADTVEEDNNEGSWIGWKLAPVSPISELDEARSVFEEAKQFTQQCIDGVAKADHGSDDGVAGAYGGGGGTTEDDDGDM